MKFLKNSLLVLFITAMCFPQNTKAQNWQNPGSMPDYPIAYDQNGQKRTVVTTHNVYQSTDGGNSWQQKLSAANAPFLNASSLNYPSGVEGKFQYFYNDLCRVFDDVVFLTANVGTSFSSNDWKIYASTNGGTTLKEVFFEEEAYLGATYGYDHEIYKVDANTFIIRFQSNGIQPSGDKSSIYVSNDKGQNWNLLFRFAENNIDYAGETASDYVFLHEDQLIYRNKNTGALSGTLTLPEYCWAASVNNSNIRLVTWTANSSQLRGYRSTNGGSSFTSFSTNTNSSNFVRAQIFGETVFASGGGFSYQSKTYRTSFNNWNNVVGVSDAGFYKDYFPYRETSDGQLANLLIGTWPHVPNVFANSDGENFQKPFYVSNDNWSTKTLAERPPISLDALPSLQGKHLYFGGPYAWNTTDGVNFTQPYEMSNWPSTIRYFQGAVQTDSYSDPSTTYYITNDATTVASNEPDVVGAGNNLYSQRGTFFSNFDGIHRSTDGGETWSQINDGCFWNRDVYGDDVTGTLYSFELTGFVSGQAISFRVSKSTDEGNSWQLLPDANFPTVTGEDYYYNRFLPIVVYNNYFFVKSDETLYYSINGGASFQAVSNMPFVVAGSQMYQLGDDLCFRTAAEQFYRVNINQWLGAGGGGTLPGANVDIELSVNMVPANPSTWSNFEVTYTVINKGTIPATGISLYTFIAGNADAIPQGGTSPTPGGGFSSLFNNSLQPGESGTITYHYFRKDGAAIVPWGQISNYDEPDLDSKPGNGSYPNVTEDDEAIFDGNNDPCNPDVNAPSISGCPSNITQATGGASANVSWTAPTASDNCTNSPSLTSTHQPGSSFPIGSTTVTYTATDNANNSSNCSFTVTVNQQSDPCNPDVTPPTINCPNNITQTISGTSTSVNWFPPNPSDNCTNYPSLTGTHIPGASFSIGTTTVTYTATDNANNSSNCSFTVTINQQGGGGDIDLELSLSQSNTSPDQWSSYPVIATLTNTGGQTATGVKVHFPKPTGVVYTGGNEYTVSQGSFQPFGAEEWNVGSVPAGGSVTMEVSYFLLTSDAPTAYAQVSAANQNDADSTPGNGTCCTPNEDDEASTSGGGNPGGGQKPDLRITDLKIDNSPIDAGQVLTYDFDAANDGNVAVAGNFTIKGYISTDANLSNNDIQDGTIATGNYAAGVTIADVLGASTIPSNLAAGQYYLILKIDADGQMNESNEGNNTVAQPFTINGGGTGDPCDNISVSTGNGEMTISNANAGHVIIKVFAPNWATVFDCLDNSCGSPQNISGLNGGTHYVSVKLFDASWGEICKYEEFINVPNPINNTGGNFLSVPNFLGRPIRLLGIQPNPVFHGETTAVILSDEEGYYDLDVYDVFGRKALTQKVELEKGRNEVRLDIGNFRDGTYYLNMPGHNWRHMPVRFVVTRW